MHPRGTFDWPAWEMIGRVYGYVKACQPWCEDARSAADVGLLRPTDGSGRKGIERGEALEGAVRMLTHLRQQFDVLTPESNLRP